MGSSSAVGVAWRNSSRTGMENFFWACSKNVRRSVLEIPPTTLGQRLKGGETYWSDVRGTAVVFCEVST